MPKKGNPSFYNSSYMTPRKAPPRPRIFKEDRFRLSEILKEAEKDYRFKQNEIFKRMKITTFVQLLVQVADYDLDTSSQYSNGQYTDRTNTDRPDTADIEVQKIQKGSSPSQTERNGAAGDTHREAQSKLENVVKGVGEIRENKPQTQRLLSDCPYLLLDVRESDSYNQCHIITSKSYPTAMLSRMYNQDTEEMRAYKNQPGKIIIVYDEDEALAHRTATTLVERSYDNLFLLSGGMKVAYQKFPNGLLTGTPSQNVTEAKHPPTNMVKASKEKLSEEDVNGLHMQLDAALSDRSTGSRLSNASTSSSRMSGATSQMSRASKPEWAVKGRKAFKN
ncbi:centrosomal protein of 41 kDa-like isoform X2 [Mizuhopecten yessoensis]|uniref:centrosomal protein of 41 kDa-like isoform X2 n=1 Tax=Mizuhopecten yessoensis TaxID=6573 RepID=UPI000B45E11F|nr:centrosomal protein of 41 kDa-like isoform X2 [Mizuhopecten yessoensis]